MMWIVRLTAAVICARVIKYKQQESIGFWTGRPDPSWNSSAITTPFKYKR